MSKNKLKKDKAVNVVERVYDDEGVIYLDKGDFLRDRNDAEFFLPPPEGGERMRRDMFAIINNVLKTEQVPAANEAYDRLKSAGAGELEVRALLANIWMTMTYEAVKTGNKWTEEKLNQTLTELKRFSEMDKSELDAGLFGLDDDEDGSDIDVDGLDAAMDAMVYDDAGNIYVDGAGRLRDKNDPNFKVAKAKDSEDEMIRLTLFSIVNDCLRDDKMPLARETYDRLRGEGAGDLEARALMTTVWMSQVQHLFASEGGDASNVLAEGLSRLKVKR
ncbi:MAG TPA: hypothetical protein V6C76_01455 [Drouetiella sp.]